MCSSRLARARQNDGHPAPCLVCEVGAPASELVAGIVHIDSLELLLVWQLACACLVDLQLLGLAHQFAVEVISNCSAAGMQGTHVGSIATGGQQPATCT